MHFLTHGWPQLSVSHHLLLSEVYLEMATHQHKTIQVYQVIQDMFLAKFYPIKKGPKALFNKW